MTQGSSLRSPEAEAHRRLYKLARWYGPNGLRLRRLRAEPLCRMCAAEGRVTPATLVDHIIEPKGNEALFFDYDNTQSLCDDSRWRCHSSRKQSQERTGRPAVVIGLDGWPAN